MKVRYTCDRGSSVLFFSVWSLESLLHCKFIPNFKFYQKFSVVVTTVDVWFGVLVATFGLSSHFVSNLVCGW